MQDADDSVSAEDIERHRIVFIEAAAMALWVGQDPVSGGKDLDAVAKKCWLEANRLWKQRTLDLAEPETP